MTDIKKIGALFGLALILASCSGPLSVISIEVLEPATITYPENVRQVGYLNRSPRSFDSFKRVSVDSLTEHDLFFIDTIICASILKGFEDAKINSSLTYLDDVFYLEARRSDTLQKASLVSEPKVSEICKLFGLDALITQDYYTFEFDETYFWNDEGTEFMRILIQEAQWTVSVPGKTKPLDTYTVYDTLYYGNQSKQGKIRYLTPLEMLADGSHVLGYIFGRRNVPVWNELSRIVYVGRQEELKKAKDFTDKGDWDKAHHLWSQSLYAEDHKLAAKCAHNIAIYYELEDEIETAIAFSSKALELWPGSSQIESYKQELEVRLLNKKDIARQLRISLE